MIKQKGFQDYLNDDPSLTEKITYEEFIEKKTAPKDNEEISIEEAYKSCRRVLEADNMLNALSEQENVEDYKDYCDDYDLDEILKFCNDGRQTKHLLRYPNGQEEYFSFGDEKQ